MAGFRHARRIAGYNRPLYLAAGLGIVAGFVVIAWPGAPAWLKWVAAVGIAAACWLSAASFLAFHWMFDRSPLLGGTWIEETARVRPRRWVQVNAGLEETTVAVGEAFPEAEGRVLDIYDPAAMTEPAITRARREKAGGEVTRPEALPVADGWADLVLVTLAAHEIRDRGKREKFFGELRRIVSVGGRVVVVEHLRDLPAALAFGPGVFHFLPRREWLRLAKLAGMEVERERAMTPFVRVFVCRARDRQGE